MELSIIGISGSPVKQGNVDFLLQAMLDSAGEKGVSKEIVSLADSRVEECRHCNFCLKKQTPGRYCAIKDDAQGLFEKIERADILVLSSPVYFMRTSARMAALIDRLRVFIFGNVAAGRLKNKIGVSAAVAWCRHGGLETTHLSHLYAFLTLEMIPASAHRSASLLGASAVSGTEGGAGSGRDARRAVEGDAAGLQSAAAIMKRALELAAIVRKGSGGPGE